MGTIFCEALEIESFERCSEIYQHNLHVYMQQRLHRKRDNMFITYKSLDSYGSKSECKDLESIQSSTTPDPGHRLRK